MNIYRRNSEDRSVGGSGSHPPRNTSSSSKGVIAAAASSSRSKVLKRSPQKVVEKNDHVKILSHAATTAVCSSGLASSSDEKMNGLVHQEQVKGLGMNHHENHVGSGLPQEAGCCNTTSTTTTTNNHHGNTKMVTAAATVNGGGEVFEWPRVLIPLTRKEKEEDFLLMKGTKLPHRPKKRPKAVDRMLQVLFFFLNLKFFLHFNIIGI